MKLRELLTQRMIEQGSNPTQLSRELNLNVATIKRALTSDGKISIYGQIAKALNCKIRYTLD